MNVLVLGAGTVGSSIAEILCQHQHSVTVIDTDAERTMRLAETLDVRTLTGSACQASVLFQANVSDCDFCLAVTGIDEVNLISASIAKSMGADRTMARVFAPVFHDNSTIDYRRHFHIDRLLSLEYLSAVEFARAIRNPGALALENIARGEIEMQEFLIDRTSTLTSNVLKDVPLEGVRIGLITRNGDTWIAGAQDRLELNDRVLVVGPQEKINEVAKSFQKKRPPKQMILIAGGGETGLHLAKLLDQKQFSISLLEIDAARCESLANQLKHVTVVQADATRKMVLEEERAAQADVLVSCLGDDEECIMVAVEASELGASRVMSLVNRPDYANVVGKLGIDVAISPRQVTARQVLGFLNQGAIVARIPTPNRDIEFIEIEVGDNSEVCGLPLSELKLPHPCLIIALTRDEYCHLPQASDCLQARDSILVLAEAKDEKTIARIFATR